MLTFRDMMRKKKREKEKRKDTKENQDIASLKFS